MSQSQRTSCCPFVCVISPVLNRYVPHRCMHSFYMILNKLSLSLSFKATVSCKSIPVKKNPFTFFCSKTPARRDHSSEAKGKFRHVFRVLKCAYQCHCLMRNKCGKTKVVLTYVTLSWREQVHRSGFWTNQMLLKFHKVITLVCISPLLDFISLLIRSVHTDF